MLVEADPHRQLSRRSHLSHTVGCLGVGVGRRGSGRARGADVGCAGVEWRLEVREQEVSGKR